MTAERLLAVDKPLSEMSGSDVYQLCSNLSNVELAELAQSADLCNCTGTQPYSVMLVLARRLEVAERTNGHVSPSLQPHEPDQQS